MVFKRPQTDLNWPLRILSFFNDVVNTLCSDSLKSQSIFKTVLCIEVMSHDFFPIPCIHMNKLKCFSIQKQRILNFG